MKTTALLLLLVGLATGVPLSAHHGNAAYDMRDVEMKNVTITKFSWQNPHCIVQFDVKDPSGKVTHWAAELGSPSAISLVGFTKTSLQPGDVVTLHITVTKSGLPVGRIRRIILADGTTLPRGGGDAPDDVPGSGRGGSGAY